MIGLTVVLQHLSNLTNFTIFQNHRFIIFIFYFRDIDLTRPHRCIVKNIEKECGKISLTLNSCKNSDEQCECILGGIW